MSDLRDVELRIAVAEGVLSRAEADALAAEARRKEKSPLALLVEQGLLSDDDFQLLLTKAHNDPAWRVVGGDTSSIEDVSPTENTSPSITMQGAELPLDAPVLPVAARVRYHNARLLGRGGMGTVFRATDSLLHREVALKFVVGDNSSHVGQLIAEARIQARISDDRICRIYDVGEVEGKAYIAMQYSEGTPLGRLASELSLKQKVMLMRSAAEAIHAAHCAGVIHRDIKPSNILVERGDDGELRPFVMDFGLARLAQEAGTVRTHGVVGTPSYMAPEQTQSDAKLDGRVDVYGLGATLYHLVTGESANPGGTVAEVLRNLTSSEPRTLPAFAPSVPIDLQAIVLKCLEKDRAARYESARSLAADLDRFLNGEMVLARSADIWYRLRKRLLRHRQLLLVAGIALIAAVGWAMEGGVDAAGLIRPVRDLAASHLLFLAPLVISFLMIVLGGRLAARTNRDEESHEYDA